MTFCAFPFAAVTGMEPAKQALILLAVDPCLGGVLVAGGPGTAKSLLVRSFQWLLPEAPFVEVPLGVTDDRLLGAVCLEGTLRTGRRRMAEGLLARAHGGFLQVDEINLLDARLARHIGCALRTGVVRLEREGLSARIPSAFALIGTYDPAEGEVSGSLREAAAIQVFEPGARPGHERLEIVNRMAAFERDPPAFASGFADETASLRERIRAARERLPGVRVDSDSVRRLSLAALRLGVEGHLADIYALRAARARAALMGRASPDASDLEAAEELVLAPRSRQGGALPTRLEHTAAEAAPEEKGTSQSPAEDRFIEALDTNPPRDLLEAPPVPSAGNGPRDRGRRASAGRETPSAGRGRYVRAGTAKGAGKIALAATLRAAAPFQIRRRSSGPPGPAVRVHKGDLRFKQFRQKTGILVVFAVDSSGSMALNRIHQAKGALLRLLRQSYLHRDQVALIGFRGGGAEVLLEPSRSVELARRALDAMPVGGGTPLAAGLGAALDLIRRARYKQPRPALLVLFTDGRANVALESGESATGPARIWPEIERMCAVIRREGIASVVVDTTYGNAGRGEAARVAASLGGRRLLLPPPNASVPDEVAAAADGLRLA